MEISKLIFCLTVLFSAPSTTSQLLYEDILRSNVNQIKEQLSPECQQDLNATTFSSPWFWLMVDSSSRIPSGIAKGNFISMGNYDECLDISQIETKFCKASINSGSFLPKRINTEMVGVAQKSDPVGLGLYYCVLKACSSQDLNLIFHDFVKFDDEQCWAKDSRPALDPLAIAAIAIFAALAFITLISTGYDIFITATRRKSLHQAMLAFSLYTNSKKLFSLGNPQEFASLNGIKAVSMLWVVLGHVFMTYAFAPVDNYLEVYEWLDSSGSQYITGATVSVDTFFVVAGFLTLYSFQTAMDKGGKFNVPLFYFHRYLRLTPALAAMVLAHVALFNYLGSGPIWNNTDAYLVRPCKEYWWAALLYVQNYANPSGVCVPQSWYLSVDMQLFLISPVLLIMMRRWTKWGYLTLSITSVLSITASFIIGWVLELNGQMTGNITGNLQDFMVYYYNPTHTRMPPYLFGIMLGQLVYKLKSEGTKPKLGWVLVLVGWVTSLAVLAACLYGGHTLQFTEYNRLANAFYIAFMRPAWALAVCWIVFACVTDHGGPINDFLSLPVFQILSRLCYSIYLVHYSFLFMTSFSARSPQHFSDFEAIHKFWGDFAFSFVIAVVWTLIFESPVIVLEKLFLPGKSNRTNKDNTKTQLV